MSSSPLFSSQPIIAQTATPPNSSPNSGGQGQFWMYSSFVLLVIVASLLIYGKIQFDKTAKTINFEKFKNKDLNKKLKLALTTIKKMETNPDLVHSREFNLDYLRMRMDEEVFHYAIINQIKIKVKQLISVALRPSTATTSTVGVANSSGRQIDEVFDVTYETESQGRRRKGVLFRAQVQLTKLPTQSTSSTIQQIIDCIETFLSPGEDHENWQPTIQGRVAIMQWDQKAKPTPLLVLQQSGEGVNVSFRTNPNARRTTHPEIPQRPKQSRPSKPNSSPISKKT
jgi:hypothetical protein